MGFSGFDSVGFDEDVVVVVVLRLQVVIGTIVVVSVVDVVVLAVVHFLHPLLHLCLILTVVAPQMAVLAALDGKENEIASKVCDHTCELKLDQNSRYNHLFSVESP